jgi:L-ascorbate metabolism protein UlaG (beta-lactamase superfamily)
MSKTAPGVAILNRMLSIKSGVALCWLGNVGWLISDGRRLIAFDLDLDGGPRPNETGIRLKESPVSAEEIAPALAVQFLSHEHEDHFNSATSAILARKSGCLFVVPADCEGKALALGVPRSRVQVARPGEAFDLPGLKVTPQYAIHGGREGAVAAPANPNDCGYLFTFGGKTFLQPGDTVLLESHLALSHVDVLFVSPTQHNMPVDRAAILIDRLAPAHIFPQHFGTYVQEPDNVFWTRGYPDELGRILSPSLRDRYHRLEQGEVFVIE